MKHKAIAIVSFEVVTEFEDDGKHDINDQAQEAIDDEIPMGVREYEIDRMEVHPIHPADEKARRAGAE